MSGSLRFFTEQIGFPFFHQINGNTRHVFICVPLQPPASYMIGDDILISKVMEVSGGSISFIPDRGAASCSVIPQKIQSFALLGNLKYLLQEQQPLACVHKLLLADFEAAQSPQRCEQVRRTAVGVVQHLL